MAREKKLRSSSTERLRALWDEGIDSGKAEPLNIATIKSDGRRRLARENPPKPQIAASMK